MEESIGVLKTSDESGPDEVLDACTGNRDLTQNNCLLLFWLI